MSATQRICLECGAEFVPRHHSQTICSDECRRLRDNRLCEESRVRCREKKRKNDESKRNEKANRRAAFFAERDAGTPPSTAKAHSYAPDERRPAWALANGRPFRPWRKKGDKYCQPPRAPAAHQGERKLLNHGIHERIRT